MYLTIILKNFVNQAYASIIAEAAKNRPMLLYYPTPSRVVDWLRVLVLNWKPGIADGAVSLPETANGKFIVKKTAFSGKAFATVELTSAKKVIALTANSRIKLVDRKPNERNAEDFSVENKESDFKAMLKEIIKSTDKVSLPDAEIVVSAGRGLKGPENWGMIEELAGLLGAATACSKPVSDAGWRPHSEHVGQTGIAVSPNLYIAIGISGAIQHLAGISSSKVIVVINKDAEAPFFKVADYGIVGDAFEIVPKLIDAVKAYKASA
jgi:electron transfer flavoprotein alpha subunit